jgi:hypothetical protein
MVIIIALFFWGREDRGEKGELQRGALWGLGTGDEVQSTKYKVQSTKYEVPSTKYEVRRGSGVWCITGVPVLFVLFA